MHLGAIDATLEGAIHQDKTWGTLMDTFTLADVLLPILDFGRMCVSMSKVANYQIVKSSHVTIAQ